MPAPKTLQSPENSKLDQCQGVQLQWYKHLELFRKNSHTKP